MYQELLLKEIRKKPDVKETSKKTPMKKSKYAHNLKMVGMPQDGGYMNQDYVIKGISTNLSQGNPNNKQGEYKDKNKDHHQPEGSIKHKSSDEGLQ